MRNLLVLAVFTCATLLLASGCAGDSQSRCTATRPVRQLRPAPLPRPSPHPLAREQPPQAQPADDPDASSPRVYVSPY
jgi:hypothetical protein